VRIASIMNTFRFGSAARRSSFSSLDVRAKLVLLMATTVLAFSWESPVLSSALACGVLLLWPLAWLEWRDLKRLLLLLSPFLVIILLVHGVFNEVVGRTPLLGPVPAWVPLVGGRLRVTSEGLLYGLVVINRTLALILILPVVVLTTDPNTLVVGLVRLRVPYTGAFVFSSALRFLPLVLGEAAALIEAQRLRGVALEKLGLWARGRAYARVAVPLVLGTLIKSQQLEVVLQSKAFSGSAERTYLVPLELRTRDRIVIGVSVLGVLVALVLRFVYGIGAFDGPV
jgi:energy-coupling factor transport system permease protein